MTTDSLLLFIVTGFIISIDGNIIDFDDADLLFNVMSIRLATNPNQPFYYDVLPPLREATAHKFVLKFRVASQGDAHVILAEENRVKSYDIVFGADRNYYVTIKKCEYSDCFETVRSMMPDAVGLDKPSELWVAYDYEGGLVKAGRGGDGSPYIEWKDPERLRVREQGFSTWRSGAGEWWFPPSYDVSNCGSMIFRVDSTYSYRYTLPVLTDEFAMDFEFEFYAQAPADVRILLASVVGLDDNDAAYEIGWISKLPLRIPNISEKTL